MSIKGEFWARLLEKQGFAIFFGVAVLAMAWYGGAWVGNELLLPIRDGHLKFMDRVATSTETSAEGVQSLSQEAKGLRSSLDGIDSKLSRALEALGRNE